MSFISAGFFMAMALTACLYYLIPKKYQWELLLFVSFGFYATYGIVIWAIFCLRLLQATVLQG